MLVKKILVARMIAWALLVIFCLILGMTSVAGDITTTPVMAMFSTRPCHYAGVTARLLFVRRRRLRLRWRRCPPRGQHLSASRSAAVLSMMRRTAYSWKDCQHRVHPGVLPGKHTQPFNWR